MKTGQGSYIRSDMSEGASTHLYPLAGLSVLTPIFTTRFTPINWFAVISEWQRDWARVDTAAQLAGLMIEHCGATGVAYAWEQQLLNTPVTAQ